MAALAGFEVAYVSRMGTTLNRIGSPDADLLTASELVDNAARCIGASGLPTVVDAGWGFGNPINVRRTVEELRAAGAAGVLLRDTQDSPTGGNASAPISPAEMAAKLTAARDVRGASLVVIAAVDPRQASSLDDLAARVRRYRESGADLIHVGKLHKPADIAPLARALGGGPLTCSADADSEIDPAALCALGFRLVVFPHCGLMAAVPAIEHTFAELRRAGTVGHLRARMADFRQFTDIAGLPEVQSLETRYGVPDDQRTTL
jgi:2-methylisocitrate lyase-like PEP mutase family enzyme